MAETFYLIKKSILFDFFHAEESIMKFPNKTAYELRQYFNQLTLTQLIEINRSYEPHFYRLDDRISQCTVGLISVNARLIALTQRKQAYEQTLEAVELREAEYQKVLASVLDDSSRTGRFLARKALSASPMETYDFELFNIETEISRVSNKIEQLIETSTDLEQKKRRAVSELRTLNSVIEEKRQYLADASQTAQPSIS
ncbi:MULTISPECIES: hypothetical protein [Legionella]|uniref:Uncharacterized protein n=2 Tax=Legionella steelei TaxID=947033 RepID=A0A0W0ZJD7_9GAMM|nr:MULTISPECIES: hypothetical protein [Legionella]KTD69113.1 hypothetical protein Lste_2271 [Legionella steelei]MBN9225763.1 hypothetical protein [Legionella steelei]